MIPTEVSTVIIADHLVQVGDLVEAEYLVGVGAIHLSVGLRQNWISSLK